MRFSAAAGRPASYLFSYQLSRPAQEHLRRQVLTSLSAQRTGHNDGPEGELLYPGGHVPRATFALNYEQFAFLYSETHQSIIGEEWAKGIHRVWSAGQKNPWPLNTRILRSLRGRFNCG